MTTNVTGEPVPPRVAVVIPCFNDGETLTETLASVDRHAGPEVVVVDDGSTDPATLAILDQIREPGVRVVRQKNMGLAAARMTGVRETTAPLICPLDSDDLMAPGALADLVAALEADTSAVLAWGDQRTIGAIDLFQRRARRLDPWAISYVNHIPGGASLIRREALLSVGGWTMQTAYEDWDLLMSFAERGWRGIHVGRTTLLYRITEGRMLATAKQDHHDRLYSELRARHPALFAARRKNWRASAAPLRMRLGYPILDALPLSAVVKHRAHLLLAEPVRTVRVRWQRYRRRRQRF